MTLHVIAGGQQRDPLLLALAEYQHVLDALTDAGVPPELRADVDELVRGLVELACELQTERAEQRIARAALRLL